MNRIFTLAFGLSLASLASAAPDEASVRRLIMVVEYVAGDYGAAVENGKIISADEYAEMHNFSASADREFEKIQGEFSPAAREETLANLAKLKTLIDQKAGQDEVRAVVKAVKDRVMAAARFNTAPKERPDRELALKAYGQYCATCHGDAGKGDGPASKGMEPPPRDFHEVAAMEVGSPFKFYNTLEIGVEGTQMPAFKAALSDQERWSLAFLLPAYRFGGVAPAGSDLPTDLKTKLDGAGLTLERLAKTNDLELEQWLVTIGMSQSEALAALPLLRTTAPFSHALAIGTPAVANNTKAGGLSQAERFALIETNVAAARAKLSAGDGDAADGLLLDAYLQGFEGFEVPLGVAHKPLIGKAEQAFIGARDAARAKDFARFELRLAELNDVLNETKAALAPSAAGGGASEFVSGAVIILREGFEAFLIIAALLALLTNMGAAEAKKWVHFGWLTAIAAGFASYYAFTWIFKLSGAGRETVEAVSTALAAGVLFYVSFWLLNQSERGKWEKYIKTSARESGSSANQKVGTLFFIAFIAVYREAAETVLFYQALSSSAVSQASVWGGFALGATALFVICYGIMKFGLRLPLKRFFLITSSLMIGISIMLAGKAMHELVEAGFLHPTEIAHFPRIEVLGIYPEWEALGVQLALLAVTAIVLFVSSARKAARAGTVTQ